jgi:glycosyltransferase involved in cell wall biosynthesis
LKIGIVTISYNQRPFLIEAIESVLSAGLRERLKYVVVDPGSIDGSRDVIQSYGSGIDISIFEPDRGPADGLNKGFAACPDCEILGYLNSDDRFIPKVLDWVYEYFLTNSGTDVLLGGISLIDANGHEYLRPRVSDKFSLNRYAVGACNVFQQGTFFRRRIFEATGGFNIGNKSCWDGELVVDMALAGGRFRRTRRLLGQFRIYPESITGSQRFAVQYQLDQERIANKIYETGVKPYPKLLRELIRLGHKSNPIRQLEYMVARWTESHNEPA